MIPIVDLILLLIGAYIAFVNAGTFLGWVFTVAVVAQTYLIVKFIRET